MGLGNPNPEANPVYLYSVVALGLQQRPLTFSEIKELKVNVIVIVIVI